MTQTSHDTFAAFVGIDWADAKHNICLQAAGIAKRECFQLDHTPEALDAWVTTLRTRCNGQPMAICLELTKGPLVSALRTYDLLVLFPINPLTLARYREAFTPSRATDDPTDAALQCELLLTPRDKLQPLQPQRPPMRALPQLVAHRRRVVGDKVRITNRLPSALKNYFPQVLQWFQDTDTRLFCDLLSRWPTLKAAQLARRSTLEAFLRDHHGRTADVLATRLHAIKTATPLTTDEAGIAPNALLVQALVSQLRVTLDAIEAFDQARARAPSVIPIAPCFRPSLGRDPSWRPGGSSPAAHNGNVMPPPLHCKNMRGVRREPNAAARQPGCAGVSSVQSSSGNHAWSGLQSRCGMPAGPRSLISGNVTRAARLRPLCVPWRLRGAVSCLGVGKSALRTRHLPLSRRSFVTTHPCPTSGQGILNDCKNTLTAPLRACVRPSRLRALRDGKMGVVPQGPCPRLPH